VKKWKVKRKKKRVCLATRWYGGWRCEQANKVVRCNAGFGGHVVVTLIRRRGTGEQDIRVNNA